MKIYIEEAEIGSTISYTEENGKKQNLYVHDKEGFVFKSLKEKLAEKDKKIAELKEELIDATDFKGSYYHDLQELKKELTEKDKEIETLKKSVEFLSSDKVVSEEQCKQIAREAQMKVFKENIELIHQTIRHEICEEIREKLNEIEKSIANNIFLANETIKTETKQKAVYENIFKILDQIEGEK